MGKTTVRTSRRRVLLAVAVVLSLSLGASARAATLRWKFTPGETLHYQMDQKTITEAKFNGQDIKTTLTQTLDTTWEVKSVTADGSAEMTQTLDRVRTKIESAFGTFEYDSKEGKEPEGPIAAGVVPTLKALVGAKFQYKISPQGELSDVRVPEGLIKTLKESGPAASGGMYSEDGLKNMITESSLTLPKDDVAKGKSWSRPSKLPLGPIGTLALDKTYSYQGTESNSEKIGLEVKATLEPDPAGNKIDVKLGAQEGKGTFLFDNKAGRVVNSSVSQKMEMLINVMDKQITNSSDTSTVMKLIEAKGPAPK